MLRTLWFTNLRPTNLPPYQFSRSHRTIRSSKCRRLLLNPGRVA